MKNDLKINVNCNINIDIDCRRDLRDPKATLLLKDKLFQLMENDIFKSLFKDYVSDRDVEVKSVSINLKGTTVKIGNSPYLKK